MNTSTRLSIRQTVFSYPGRKDRPPTLRNVNLDVEPGEVVALMGPSGCGKSTLLHVASGLIAADHGEIHYDDTAIHSLSAEERASERLKHVAVVMQAYNLITHDTVFNNVALPLEYGNPKTTQAGIASRVNSMLSAVGIDGYARRAVKKLSGGEKQRVAIARALAVQPRILIADEPTAALDAENLSKVCDLIRQQADTGTAVLISTHDPRVADTCDRALTMSEGSLL